ncbi:MAG: DNA polymerase III subunit delta [Candidatus Omnitrophica bacterium]|nr:DNA polymerase III subunit delta [Candidatus Omnitrophota bacterium]
MKTGDPLASVILCVGSERWLRDRAIRQIVRRAIAPGFEETDLVRFAEPPPDPQAVLEAARTLPFGSPYRLVVIEGVEGIGEAALPWLYRYLAQPNPRACLVLCLDRLDREAELASLRRSGSVGIVRCQPLKGSELKGWIVDQGTGAGCRITPEAASLLIQRLGGDLGRLALAIESLSLLASDAGRISAAHVEGLIAPSVRETAFDILDAAASGQPAAAVASLRQALASGQLTVEIFMGALGWYYRMAWKARKGAPSSSWNSGSRQAALRRMGRWPEGKLRVAFEEVLRADAALKWGHPNPELLADQLLLELAS